MQENDLEQTKTCLKAIYIGKRYTSSLFLIFNPFSFQNGQINIMCLFNDHFNEKDEVEKETNGKAVILFKKHYIAKINKPINIDIRTLVLLQATPFTLYP